VAFEFEYESSGEDNVNFTAPLVTENRQLEVEPQRALEITENPDSSLVPAYNREADATPVREVQYQFESPVVAQVTELSEFPEPTAPPAEWLTGPNIYVNINRPVSTVETASSPITVASQIVELQDAEVNTDASYKATRGTNTEIVTWASHGTGTETVVFVAQETNTDIVEWLSTEVNTDTVSVQEIGTNTEIDEPQFVEPTNWEYLYLRVSRLRFLRRVHAQLGFVLQGYTNIRPYYRTE